MKSKTLNQFAAVMVGCGMLFSAPMAVADSDDPIKIPLHNWSSQTVGARVVAKILNEAGYETELIPSDSQVVYQSMCEGDMDLVHEVWEGAFGPAFEKQVKAGCVLDAVTHSAVTREEWWYPIHVEKLCPGLPDWKALNACAELFATPETAPKGRFLGGPVDWLKGDAERVEGLGMDFQVINAGSASALWAELKSAVDRNAPIVLFNWTPNFVEAVWDGKFIEFPEYDDRCKEDAAWGVNPSKKYDCGNPRDGYLKIGVWNGLPEKWPGAYQVIRRMNFTNADLALMAKLADTDEMEHEDAAAKWMTDNPKWREWLN